MADLAHLIFLSPSLNRTQKEDLLGKIVNLTEEQRKALQKVFEDEKKEYEKLDQQYLKAWQTFAKNLGEISLT